MFKNKSDISNSTYIKKDIKIEKLNIGLISQRTDQTPRGAVEIDYISECKNIIQKLKII